jgi:hypothetical protein
MGSGKTTSSSYAMHDACIELQATHAVGMLALRIDHLTRSLNGDKWKTMESSTLLARVIIWASDSTKFVKFLSTEQDISLGNVFEKVIRSIDTNSSRKPVVLLLHVDEAQHERELAKKLREACEATCLTETSSSVKVIPVVSGVLGIGIPTLVSGTNTKVFYTKPLEHDLLCECFHDSLSLLQNVKVEDDSHLFTLFSMCGGSPHLVKVLMQTINQIRDANVKQHWEKVKSGETKLDVENASEICKQVLEGIRLQYGEARWHEAAGGKPQPTAEFNKRDSWQERSKKNLTRLFLDVMLELKVENIDDLIISHQPEMEQSQEQNEQKKKPATYHNAINTGLIRYDAETKTLSIPMFGLMCLDALINVFPVTAKISEPFLTDWETNERIAMASIYLRLFDAQFKKEKEIQLKRLRPHAEWCADADNVMVLVPDTLLTWEYLKYRVTNTSLQTKEYTSVLLNEIKTKLQPGSFVICAPNQKATDGFVRLKCRFENKVMQDLVLGRQVKSKSLAPGDNKTTPLFSGTLLKEFIPQMKKICNQCLPDALIVCDIFSTYESPKEEALDERFNYDNTGVICCAVRAPAFKRELGPVLSQLAYVAPNKRQRTEDDGGEVVVGENDDGGGRGGG